MTGMVMRLCGLEATTATAADSRAPGASLADRYLGWGTIRK